MYSVTRAWSITKKWCNENFCKGNTDCLAALESRDGQGFRVMQPAPEISAGMMEIENFHRAAQGIEPVWELFFKCAGHGSGKKS